MRPQPHAVVLLGAQRFEPTLADTVAEVGVTGDIAVITAGWQERESEDEELAAHLGDRTVNLELHKRADRVFKSDPELAETHRKRQERMRDHQDLYRVRLEAALEAIERIADRKVLDEVRKPALSAAMLALREIDQWHLAQCASIRADFNKSVRPLERKAVMRERAELASLVGRCNAIAIAGGHVATLLNRLELFHVAEFIGHRAVFAWSAGAMAISQHVVLFHDDPPQGAGAAEVLDAGLGLVPGVVVLPQPERRLHLNDKARVGLMAKRFAPATCLAFPARSHAAWHHGHQALGSVGVLELTPEGKAIPYEPPMHTPMPASPRGRA